MELAICLQTPALSAAALPFASETFSWGFNLQNIRRGESCHGGASRRVLISTGLRYLRISSREGTRVLNMGLQTPGMGSQKYVVFNWDLVTIISGDCWNPSKRLLVPSSTESSGHLLVVICIPCGLLTLSPCVSCHREGTVPLQRRRHLRSSCPGDHTAGCVRLPRSLSSAHWKLNGK